MFDKSVHILKEMTLNSAFTDCLQLSLSHIASYKYKAITLSASLPVRLSSLSVRLSASVHLLFCYQDWLPAYTMYIFIKVTLIIVNRSKCVSYSLISLIIGSLLQTSRLTH